MHAHFIDVPNAHEEPGGACAGSSTSVGLRAVREYLPATGGAHAGGWSVRDPLTCVAAPVAKAPSYGPQQTSG